MSDTHAHTAQVQAEVLTGKPHIPPGHVEADGPVNRPADRQIGPRTSLLAIAGLVLVIVLVAVFLLG